MTRQEKSSRIRMESRPMGRSWLASRPVLTPQKKSKRTQLRLKQGLLKEVGGNLFRAKQGR